MAFEYERDEWRAAVQSMTAWDHQLADDAYRQAIGVVGSADDDTPETDDDEGER